ncbi:peptidylprolyl isomerase [Candidatus Aerophobetes bacterium]|nr:peptidylprolyl isomerase [Candidatus Aerophobetes bacterium]
MAKKPFAKIKRCAINIRNDNIFEGRIEKAMIRFFLIFICLFSTTLLPVANSSLSAIEVIDEIIVAINGSIITRSQLEENIRIVQTFETKKEGVSFQEFEKIVFYDMIDDYLVKREAEKQGLSVSTREIQGALDNLQKSTAGNDFMEILRKGNISFQGLQEKITRHLLREKLINWKVRELREKIKIEDAQVKTFFASLKGYIEGTRELDKDMVGFLSLYHRQIADEEKVLIAQIIVDNKAQAEEILEKLQDNESFSDLATQYSLGPHAKQGGEIGWFSLLEIESSLRAIIAKLREGELTEPIKINEKFYQILQIKNRSELSFDSWKQKIKDYLFHREMLKLLDSWLINLRKGSFIQIMDEDLRRQWTDYLFREMFL